MLLMATMTAGVTFWIKLWNKDSADKEPHATGLFIVLWLVLRDLNVYVFS